MTLRAILIHLRWRRLPGRFPFVPTRRSLSKLMRDNSSYYPRLLTREGHSWVATIQRDPSAVSQAFLHGILHGILTRLSQRGMAAVALLEINGETVTAQSVLEYAGRLTFYYSGFDPWWHRYSPVTILHTALIQDAQARGLTALDYLPEAEPWKTRWGTEAEWVYDELSCLSPRSLLRSGWRPVTRFLHARRAPGRPFLMHAPPLLFYAKRGYNRSILSRCIWASGFFPCLA